MRFLGSIDVNGVGRQERRSHERLQKRIAEREAKEVEKTIAEIINATE